MWLTENNRPRHILAGVVIYTLWMVVPSLRGDDIIMAAFRALLVVVMAMMAVEYGQKTCGSKFDWLDVLAGCMIPMLATLILLIV